MTIELSLKRELNFHFGPDAQKVGFKLLGSLLGSILEAFGDPWGSSWAFWSPKSGKKGVSKTV